MDLGQVFTREIVSDYMVSLLNMDKNCRVLDPCFGEGVFLRSCLKQGYTNIIGIEIDKNLFDKVSSLGLGVKLFKMNFFEFKSHIKFDGIIMNPPYIRQERINDLAGIGVTKESLRKDPLFKDLSKTANLYMYFILKALDLLNDNGRLIVIFPASWMKARNADAFKRTLKNVGTLEQQIYVYGEVFENNPLVDVTILVLKKGFTSTETKISILEVNDGKIIIKDQLEEEFFSNGFKRSFPDYASVRRGLTTGSNKIFINPEASGNVHLTPILSGPKSISGFSTYDASVDYLLNVTPMDRMMDKNLDDYLGEVEGKILKQKEPKTLYDKILKNQVWYTQKIPSSKGILFNYFVRNNMKFIDHDRDICVRDNFYIIYPRIDKWLLFSLLNNYYTFCQLESMGKKYGGGLLKIQRYDIESLKFPDIESISDQDKESLKQLAQDLAQSGNKGLLEDITCILSRYSLISYTDIMKLYKDLKRKRLEEV